MTIQHETREAWLNQVGAGLAAGPFAAAGAEVPTNWRAAIGFPSTGRKGKRIGECWASAASADGHFEILIRPDVDQPMELAAILAHELIHATVGLAAKHGPKFRRVAVAIGLEGKMTATTHGLAFRAALAPILDAAGPVPHAALGFGASSAPPKQSTRMIKCQCAECGYVVRTARSWIDDMGAPLCPAHGAMEVV